MKSTKNHLMTPSRSDQPVCQRTPSFSLTCLRPVRAICTCTDRSSLVTALNERLLVGIFLIFNCIAHGQTTTIGSPTSPVPDSAVQLQEMVVTTQATRRIEDVQAVPMAITAFSQQMLQANNIQSIGDLQYLVPSMSAVNIQTRDGLTANIRGEGLTPGGTGLPGVETYFNEVPIPDSGGQMYGGPGMLFDLENVEVLKGPQGTNFGINTVGGAILLETARPTNDLGGHLQVTYGDYSDREVDAAINIPIVDHKLLVRIAFNGQLRDGFTHLISDPEYPNGVDADNRDAFGIRGTVTFKPSDRFQNDTILQYTVYNSNGEPLILDDFNPAGLLAKVSPGIVKLFAEQQTLGIRTVIPSNIPLVSSGTNESMENISNLTLNENLTFRNILGLDKANTVANVSIDATNLALLDAPASPTHTVTQQITEEPQLLGETSGDRFDWIIGGFYLYDVPTENFEPSTSIILGNASTTVVKSSYRNEAIYGTGTYQIVPNLKFTAGLRYTWDERATDGGAAAGPYKSQIETEEAISWTTSLEYQMTKGVMWYVTSRRGYRGGGYNGFDTQGNILPAYGPEYVYDGEFGVKADWKPGKVLFRTNADLYYEKNEQLQVQELAISSAGLPTNSTENAGTARAWGVEIEETAQLTPALRVGATFDYLNFAYQNFPAQVTNSALLIANSSVNRPPRKYGFNVQDYVFTNKSIGDVVARAAWMWQANSALGIASAADAARPSSEVPAFGLLNGSLSWEGIMGGRIDASFFISNALNKQYVVGGKSYYTAYGVAIERYGDPRMYGVRLNYRF